MLSKKISKERIESEVKKSIISAINNINDKQIFDVEHLVKDGYGKIDLAGLHWYYIKIKTDLLKEEYNKYDSILFMPYRINKDILKEIGDCSKKGKNTKIKIYGDFLIKVNKNNDKYIRDKYWGKGKGKKEFPHIDSVSGNIHITDVADVDKFGVKQLVLVNSKINPSGPKFSHRTVTKKTIKLNENCSYFDYEVPSEINNTRVAGIVEIAVPKACYYPRIEDSENKNENIQQMLIGLLKGILK